MLVRSPARRATRIRAVWYVDPVAGSDDNNGWSEIAPFATLARAKASTQPGHTIYLARGSRFREELTGLPAGVRVRAYGTGDRPIIDGRDVAGDLAVVPDAPNVGRIDWTHGFAADGGKSRHRVWEDDIMLTRVQSIAACDAAPGSFYSENPSTGGPDAIYIHPTGAGTIEITRRRWCIQLYEQHNQADVESVAAIGNSFADGAICTDGTIRDCVAYDGRIHNFFVLGTAIDCQAIGIDQSVDWTMFVSYVAASFGGGPSARNIIYRGCIADPLGQTAIGTGFYVHTNGDGRNFGTVQYEDCESRGCSGGFGGIQAATFLFYRCSALLALTGFPAVGDQRVVILGGTHTLRSGFVSSSLFSSATGATFELIVHGARVRKLISSDVGPIFVNAPNCTATIRRCTFVSDAGMAIWFGRGRATFDRCVVTGRNIMCIRLGTAGTQVTEFSTDQNAYWDHTYGRGAWRKDFGGVVDFTSGAAWRAHLDSIALGAGTDDNSLDVDPLVDFDTFEIGNSTVLALGAGAEPDEENDAELQALWASYRIAP